MQLLVKNSQNSWAESLLTTIPYLELFDDRNLQRTQEIGNENKLIFLDVLIIRNPD